MKNILVINGHPHRDSFNHALADSYINAIDKTKANVSIINIGDLDFDPNLKMGYRKRSNLEPDLLNSLELIQNADHLVWVFPMWWCGCPAVMKGFIDRAFLPDITYKMHEDKPFPEKLLKGKTARLIVTADSPGWYNRLSNKNAAINQIKKGVLEFCGVKPVKTTYFAPIKKSTEENRNKWLKKVEELGFAMN